MKFIGPIRGGAPMNTWSHYYAPGRQHLLHLSARRAGLVSSSIDAFSSAIEMLAALRAREISAVELLELHRQRISVTTRSSTPLWRPISMAHVPRRERRTAGGGGARMGRCSASRSR